MQSCNPMQPCSLKPACSPMPACNPTHACNPRKPTATATFHETTQLNADRCRLPCCLIQQPANQHMHDSMGPCMKVFCNSCQRFVADMVLSAILRRSCTFKVCFRFTNHEWRHSSNPCAAGPTAVPGHQPGAWGPCKWSTAGGCKLPYNI